MKILIISTNREKSPFPVVPIGAAKIIGALLKSGHEVDFLDLCFSHNIRRSIRKKIQQFCPDMIGLSIRNLDNCAYINSRAYFGLDRKIIRIIRGFSRAPIIIGGSAVSVAPNELTSYLGADYAIVGEGENSLPAFLSAYHENRGFEHIPGLLWQKKGRWHVNPPHFSTTIENFHLQAYHCIDFERYFFNGGFAAMQTKRGCPFGCIYCSYGILEGKRHRFFSPGACIDEMEKIVWDTGRTDFFFVDGVFNFPPEHAAAVCEEIIRRELKIRWLAYCNPSGLDNNMAEIFKASGCAGIELGLDAATGKMLSNLKKGFTLAEIESAYRALSRTGLPFAVFLLFGGPGETFADWEKTQRNLQRFGKANAVFASLGLRIYKNTNLFDLACQEGVIDPADSLLEPRFYLSSHLQKEFAVERLDLLARRDPTWSTPTDWNTITVKLIQWFLAKLRVIPCWKDIKNYGAYMRRQK
jgi:hypothetical protein